MRLALMEIRRHLSVKIDLDSMRTTETRAFDKLKVAVFYAFARSGGTLINRCLGCIPGNLVLSEVNPHGALVPMEVQARDWLGLIQSNATDEFCKVAYGEQVRRLAELASQRGDHLIIRDWSALNFLDRVFSYYTAASMVLEQDAYLSQYQI